MPNWDVFHADRLELERGLSTPALREAMARGDLRDDDLVRPAGTTVAWARLAEMPELLEPASSAQQPNHSAQPPTASAGSRSNEPSLTVPRDDLHDHAEHDGPKIAAQAQPAPVVDAPDWFKHRADSDDLTFPVINDDPAESSQVRAKPNALDVAPVGQWDWVVEDDEDDMEEDDAAFDSHGEIVEPLGVDDLEILDDGPDGGDEVPLGRVETPDSQVEKPDLKDSTSRLALPVVNPNDWDGDVDAAGALVEVPEEEEFSLSRSGPMTVEELDLAPMVDVAFQLVLFFMVAAQTVLYKTLEIPKPSTEQAPAAVAQGRSRTLDELKEDYILVEVDGSGAMKIDREPVAADTTALVERLRSAREATHRKAMLLSAEYATSHRNAVLAYDAANEIGLGIVIARPASPQGPAPGLLPVGAAAPAAGQPSAPKAAVPN